MVEILIFVFLVRATLQNTEAFYRIELSFVVPELKSQKQKAMETN